MFPPNLPYWDFSYDNVDSSIPNVSTFFKWETKKKIWTKGKGLNYAFSTLFWSLNLTHLRDIFRSHPVTDIPFLIILIAVFHKISLPSLRQNNFLQNRISLTKLKIKLQYKGNHCLATFVLKSQSEDSLG